MYLSLFLPLSTTENPVPYINQTQKGPERWREEGRLTRDLGIQGTVWWWVACILFFCLTYPRLVAEEAGNLAVPVNVDKRCPSRCLLSPVRGAAQQDRNLFGGNRSCPAKHDSRSVVPLLPLPVGSLDFHPCEAFTRSPSLSARMVSEKAE